VQVVCLSSNGTSPNLFLLGDIRHVLLLGQPKVGKTTVSKIFADPCWCPDKSSSVETTTLNKTFHSPHNIKIGGKQQEFCVNFVEYSFGNDLNLSKFTKECIDHGITYLNVAILIYPINKFTAREVNTVVEFVNFFYKQTTLPLILCLTFGDFYNSEKCKTSCNEIQNHPNLIWYFENKKLILQIMGCVDYLHQDFFDEGEMEEKYLRISKWRKLGLQSIIMSSKKHLLE